MVTDSWGPIHRGHLVELLKSASETSAILGECVMDKAQIRFSTDILQRLGEELNPTPDQGIIELIKNAYDANAHHCVVRFGSNSAGGEEIEVFDDGDGMSGDEIAEHWLVLGRSKKTKTQRTRLGRVPAGSKGLGRLAALRLGRTVRLESRPRSAPGVQYEVEIDWERYSRTAVVEDVELEIDSRERRDSAPDGTTIRISDIRTKISRWDVKRLARAMILLADPFADNPEGFEPVLEAPQYHDLSKLVNARYFEDSDYHLVATLNEDGRAEARVLDWKGAALFEASHEEIAASRSSGIYQCPPSKFDFWTFLLTKASFQTKTVTLSEVRDWLQTFGGVHLYENGLRVQPYGNPGNDWLDINLRRSQNPEFRPSTNTSIGRVAVADTEGLLIQKTDRSGFIESEVFQELRSFAQDALEWMARRRLEEGEKMRAQARKERESRSTKSRKKVEEVIERAGSESRKELKTAFSEYDKKRDREVRELKKEVQLYRTLSTAGITAATFAHESSGNPIKVITASIGAIERRAKKELGGQYEKLLERPVKSIKASIDSLSVLGSATLRLLDHGKRRWGRVNVHEVFDQVLETFTPFLEGRGVVVDKMFAAANPYMQGSDAAIESILTNLLNNSLAAFERGGTDERKIRIETVVEGDHLVVSVNDSGPGIEGIDKRAIWLPGYTTGVNGTGLGLTIVHDAVADLGGSVAAVEHGQLGGAEIVVRLPILGS